MKIAVISSPMLPCPPERYGGLELICWHLAEGLSKMGHKVVLLAPYGSKSPHGGLLLAFGPPAGTVHTNWVKAELAAYLRYKCVLPEFDIICDHTRMGFAYNVKKDHPEVKLAHTHHDLINHQLALELGTKRAKLNFIAISRWMQRHFLEYGIHSRVCYNGIDLDRYPYSDEHGDRLLFVGRIDMMKRPHIAIEVARKANMPLDILGGTFVSDQLYVEKIRKICLKEGYGFYPDASHKKKVELLQKCKAVIFPSKMNEPFGLVPIEANACGAPVIATIDGATPETVQNGKTGYLCNTVDQMVEALKKIDNIKHNDCRQWASKFSKENMCKCYEQRFKEILSGDEW